MSKFQPFAVVAVMDDEKLTVTYHTHPDLIDGAGMWQQEALHIPLPGPLQAWFIENRRRFRRTPGGGCPMAAAGH